MDRAELAARGVGYRDDHDNIYVLVGEINSLDVYVGDTTRLVRQSSMGMGFRNGVGVTVSLRAPRSTLDEATLEIEPPPPAPLTLVCERDVKVRLVPLPAAETKRIVAGATFHSPRVPSGVVIFGQLANGVRLLIEHDAPGSALHAFLGPKGEMQPVRFIRERREVVMLGGKDVGKLIVETSAGQYMALDNEHTWTPTDGAAMPIERMSGPDLLRPRLAEPAVYGRMGYVCDDL